MSISDLRTLRIAGVSVELASGLNDAHINALRDHIQPFADRSGSAPELTIRPAGFGALGPDVVAESFFADVMCVSRVPGEPIAAKSLRIADDESHMTVEAIISDPLELVLALHVGLARRLPMRDALLLHASAVCYEGRAFVFAGVSGSGKTTVAASFTGGRILADERIVVRRVGRGWLACPVPMWPGKYKPVTSEEVPVAAVVVLRKDMPLVVVRLSGPAGVVRLAPAVVHGAYDTRSSGRVLAALVKLSAEVGVIELSWRLGECFVPALQGAARLPAGPGEGRHAMRRQ